MFVSPLDFKPSCTPKGGEGPAQKTDLTTQVINGFSNALRASQPGGAAPSLEPGAESDAESRVLRTLRSAGTPLSTIAAVARASGLSPEVAQRAVGDLSNRRLIRRASSALGGDQWEAAPVRR
ncbi:MarR family transcriptional regulator [Methylobacterium sp. A52T]